MAPRQQRRLSLIEAAVVLVIFSVGLLGVAALYAQSRVAERSTRTRAQAVLLAADLAERIRANRAGGAGYDDARSGAGSLGILCEQGSACAPLQMARFDKAEWLNAVREVLPAASASVRVAGVPPGAYTLALRWTDPATGAESYTLSFRP